MTRAQFRDKLSDSGVLLSPLVHDALSARVAEEVGIEAIGISGFGVSLSQLGLPDAGFISFEDMQKMARHVSTAVSIPVWADLDTGYGNAVSAQRVVRESILNTNLAGGMIEDQVFPPRCSFEAGTRVISREEAVGKIEAACDERDRLDEEFVIIARTDVKSTPDGSLDQAIERGQAFHEVGADVIFMTGITDADEHERVSSEVPGFTKCIGGGIGDPGNVLDLPTAAEYGYDMYGNAPTLKPALIAMYEVLEGLSEEGIDALTRFEREHADHPMAALADFAGFGEIAEIEEAYLPATE